MDGSIDLTEDAKVVELALGVEEILLAERLSGSDLDFALDDVFAGVVEARDHHMVDEEPFAFVDVKGYVFTAGLGGRGIGEDIESGVGKSKVEITVKNFLAIIGQFLIGVGLAGFGFEIVEVLDLDGVVAGDVKIADASLRAFVDEQADREVILGTVKVVVDVGLDFCVAKSVGDIERLKVLDIAFEQSAAIASMGERAGGLNLHAGAQNLPGEIFVAGDIDEFEFMQGAGIDAIDHTQSFIDGFLLKAHFGVEQAARLEVIQEVAIAFIEQIVIDGVLFINWDFFLENTAADAIAESVDDHNGAGVDEKCVVDGVALGMIFLLGDRNLSENALLFLEFLAQVLQRVGDAGGGDTIAGMHAGNVLQFSLGQRRSGQSVSLRRYGPALRR